MDLVDTFLPKTLYNPYIIVSMIILHRVVANCQVWTITRIY